MCGGGGGVRDRGEDKKENEREGGREGVSDMFHTPYIQLFSKLSRDKWWNFLCSM